MLLQIDDDELDLKPVTSYYGLRFYVCCDCGVIFGCPVLVDVDLYNMNISIDAIRAITKTKAIVPVHFWASR
jgi:hypothetical protein